MKITGKKLLVFCIALLLLLAISAVVYESYKGARVPVYQTEITDFEMQKPKVKVNAEEMQSHS